MTAGLVSGRRASTHQPLGCPPKKREETCARDERPRAILASVRTSCLVLGVALALAMSGTAQADPWARGVARRTSTTLDESLSRAARRHAAAIAQHADAPPGSLPPGDIRAAVVREGLADAQLLTFAGLGAPSALAEQVDRFAADRAAPLEPTKMGFGRAHAADGRDVLVVVWSRRLLELPPLGVEAREAPRSLVATLLAGRSPRTFVTRPTGEVVELPTARDGRRLTVDLPLDEGRGLYDVEILVETARGPEVGALWRFAVGVPPPTATALPALATAEELAAAIDRLRRAIGQAPLASSGPLSRAALAHAQAVCRSGVAAHHLDGRGPDARAQAVGWTAPVAENIAVAPSVAAAHAQLLASPSHRRNLLLADARALGVGLARAGDRVCVVELYGLAGQ